MKQKKDVIVTDITDEAKKILQKAIKGFTSDKYKEMAYIRERKWYWQDQGYSEEESIKKALDDWEFSYGK